MSRRYKSGTRWCSWRWTDVVLNGELYLRRLHLVQTPWFSIMLHWIQRPDSQPDMHDHPVSFWSFLVRGWYIEATPSGPRMYCSLPRRLSGKLRRELLRGYKGPAALERALFTPKAINRKRATDKHRIIVSHPNMLTLVFAGPVVRSWGFHTPKGWVPWREYSAN